MICSCREWSDNTLKQNIEREKIYNKEYPRTTYIITSVVGNSIVFSSSSFVAAQDKKIYTDISGYYLRRPQGTLKGFILIVYKIAPHAER
jgi:hypothetical protein